MIYKKVIKGILTFWYGCLTCLLHISIHRVRQGFHG